MASSIAPDRWSRRRFASAAVFAVLLAACPRRTAPSAGTARRVVSISPSTTEGMFAIGSGALVVGRSRYCDYPPEVERLPQIGGYVDPSFEAILALRPDLVVGARGPVGTKLTDRLAERGVATYFPATESFREIDAMLLGLGERTGNADAARAAVAALHTKVDAVEAAVAGKKRVRVLLVFGLEPLSVAGPQSFANEMIARAGGINVITEGGAYPTASLERVIHLDPDVVVNAAMAEQRGIERLGPETPGWSKVRAIAERRIVPIADESILRPGPRIADGLRTLARALHPDAAVP